MTALLTTRYQEALARIRRHTATTVEVAWDSLAAYDAASVPEFLDTVVPAVRAGQTQAVYLTDAYLGAFLERPPIGLPVADLTGAAVRAGTSPDEVYRRPFVTTWTSLKKGTPWVDAVGAGRARAAGSAAMDVALSTRAAARSVGESDDRIQGWERVPDGSACAFCILVSGQRYRTEALMPLHNNCGCSVEPILDASRISSRGVLSDGDGTTAAIRDHGELGPVIVDGDHGFTDEI